MAKRLRRTQLENPVTFTFDGEPVVAEAGDSLAVALWADGQRALTRSPKYHRPRGPFCFGGQCEGCLLRVQDTPNTMACQVPVSEGMVASSQNFFGTPKFDLLRAADWMFPSGLNHHEFMAGVPVAEDVMKAMARRIAGLGTLPGGALVPPKAMERRAPDVLVIGGGRSGRAVAAGLEGLDVVTVDARDGDVAIGVYGAHIGALEVLVVGAERTTLYAARALVLAPGAHEGVPTFENNDLPGILSVRGAQALLARAVEPGHEPLVVEVAGATGLGRELGEARGYRVVRGTPVKASGGSGIERVTLQTDAGVVKLETDALIVDGPRTAAFELAVQAGAAAEAAPHGFQVRVDAEGVAAPNVWVTGEATGLAYTTDVPPARTRAYLVEHGGRVATSVRAALTPR